MVQDIYTLMFDIKAQGGQQLASQANTGARGVKNLDTATSNAQKTASKTSTNMNSMGKSMQTVEKNSTSAANKVRNFGGGMQTMALGVASLATGLVSLQRSYADLEDSQIAVDRTARKVSVTQEALTKANEKLSEAQKKHGKDSEEYAQAQLDVEQAEQAAELATTMHGEALEDQERTYQNFYMSLIPTAIGMVSVLSGMMGGFSRNSTAAAGSVTSMSRGMRILNTVLRFSPLFILAGVLFAIRTNAFGFRDALDKLGKKVGDMFPFLRPFLNWVRDLGEALGLTGGKLNFGKAWDLLKTGFQSAVKTIQTTDWGKVMDTIALSIENFINNYDWANAWSAFKEGLWATGAWLAPRLANIFQRIKAYFEDPAVQKAIWEGFQYAMWATGSWLYEQLGKIGDALISYFGDPKVQKMLWEGFQYAMWATGSWLYEQLGKLGDAIIKYFSDPKVQEALWNGFQTALYGTGKWILEQLGKILNSIYSYFADPKNQDAIWNGFRTALYGGGKWIGQMLTNILTFIQNWWKSNNKSLTSAFFGFFDFLYKSATTAGGKIPELMLSAVKKAGETLKNIGKEIWNAIINYIKDKAGIVWGAIKSALNLSEATGGLIRSYAQGGVMTTRGPQMVMAGDNTGGKEDVAFIPRNDPWRTLATIDRIYGRRAIGISQGGNGTLRLAITIPVVFGNKIISEIVKTVEIELGKNFRSVVA